MMNKTMPVLDWMEFVAARWTDRFKSKVSLFYETQQYVLKTAESAYEIELVLKLRHQVFFEELQNKRKFLGIELDQYDLKCDHLLIIDRVSDEVVGCYRLLSSHFFKRFYSEAEFDLSSVLALPDAKLELGRACILPTHRNGQVIQLLWRGITEYMKKTDARFLMGCSSVQTVDPLKIEAYIHEVKRQQWVETDYAIKPTLKYHPLTHQIHFQSASESTDLNFDVTMPPLIQSYLRAGAKLSALPAIDLDFNCIDFFTLLDREKMNPLFRRRYLGD